MHHGHVQCYGASGQTDGCPTTAACMTASVNATDPNLAWSEPHQSVVAARAERRYSAVVFSQVLELREVRLVAGSTLDGASERVLLLDAHAPVPRSDVV